MKITFIIILVSALLIGCAMNRAITLYPIKKTDICFKGDPDCDMTKMDVGMSQFYLNTVLQAKISK